jgi:uncharacterized protein (DUF433 family)
VSAERWLSPEHVVGALGSEHALEPSIELGGRGVGDALLGGRGDGPDRAQLGSGARARCEWCSTRARVNATIAEESVGVRGDMSRFPRITADPHKMGGVPCIRGLRIPVSTVIGLVAQGQPEAEILADYPDLEPEDVREALRFAAAAVDERELPLRTAP